MIQSELRRVLTNKNLAQLGDSILNFAFSAALTRSTGRPTGRRVKNNLMTSIIDTSALSEVFSLRTSRRDRANGFEALAGYLWLHGLLQPEELIDAMAKAVESADDDREREPKALQACFKLIVDRIETQHKVTTQT